ncbi:hypothetical protein PoB_000465800 [Plakobranchus ocellatus]|uniref:Uncharacterized protein n=1 Tax=Plakobranchus ocellatus TaxID=259542 RepID=A0AAV3Y6H4_9GAST|nr:hypothetical protein PoB_000465800 [Plakobranchus ocellatus]
MPGQCVGERFESYQKYPADLKANALTIAPPTTPSDKASSPQQGDLKLSGILSGQGTGVAAQTRDRRVLADLRADSLSTVPPTTLICPKSAEPKSIKQIMGIIVIALFSDKSA